MVTSKDIGLYVNQRIEVALESSNEYYVSAIQDITADTIFIGIPYLKRTALTFSRGDRIKVRFTGSSECFSFVTTVSGRREEGVVLIGLSFPDEVQRVQRRRDVRLNILSDVFYAEIPEGDEPPVFNGTKALDLSVSGMRLITSVGYPVGTSLLVRFRLPMQKAFFEAVIRARVMRQEPAVFDKKMLYHLGLEFLDLAQKQKDKIFSFIFWKMMEHKRLR